MNCANHPETPAAAYCRDCGKPLCPECIRRARGSVFCAEHAPVAEEIPAASSPNTGLNAGLNTSAGFAPSAGTASFAPAATPPSVWQQEPLSPYTAPVAPRTAHSGGGIPPVLAFILGFIPGVGAICNGQYAKGLIHAVVFGLLVSLAARAHGPLEPLIGIMIAAWVFYMAFEAFHTASRRRRGQPVEEFSSLFDMRGMNSRLPIGAVVLVVVGFILLLDTTDIISMEVFARYWPAGLIALGIWLLYARVHPSHPAPVDRDLDHEFAAHDLSGHDLPGQNLSDHDLEVRR